MTKIKWVVSILWLVLTVAICINTYETALDTKKTSDVVNIFLLMLGGFGVVFSIIHNTETILDNNEQIREKMNADRIENTFQLLKAWDDEHLFKARKLTREIGDMRDAISNDDLIHKIDDDPELRQSVILVLNYFEHVRFSIKQDRINTEVFKESLAPTVIDIIKRFEPYSKKLGTQNYKDMEECKQLLS